MSEVLSWLRGHKASTAGLLLVVIGCMSLVLLARRAHHLKLKPSTPSSVSAKAGAAAPSGGGAGLTPSGQAGTEQNMRSARMRSEFENATRYLDFIQQAMSRPQEGGKFYALLAWRRCNDLRQHSRRGGHAHRQRRVPRRRAGADPGHREALHRRAGGVRPTSRRCTRWRWSSAAAATS